MDSGGASMAMHSLCGRIIQGLLHDIVGSNEHVLSEVAGTGR